MRTTLAIDDDVLLAAKAIAHQQNRTLGEVVSELARKSLRRPASAKSRNGIPLLRADAGKLVTLEMVNALRDEAL
ncbi:hypothetical protein KFK14_19425 [Sphingobium phenoxybenzoativorans]|uniref:CopG family transcriptional regulator n=1 Tax=Sphingobium phenoxybenzoativorans TaxID=1592790 RepID=A0A975K624_9SPHN|nr:hypothetical protein [Sphingobium phenoxybenzoativorans]QUT05147.1 hypothetical protein KFK14_19425 [Sphingobium phenoxybenzoativorans]